MSSLILALAMSWGTASGLGRDSIPAGRADPFLDRWVDRAIARHPEVEAARWAVQAAQAVESGARAWMPPTGQLQYQSDGRVDFSLSQMVPGFGKTTALAEVRSRRTGMVRFDSADRMRKLSLAVREAAWMEWMTWQKVRVLSQQDSAWERWARALERTQAQGMGSASETWIVRAKGVQAKADLAKARAEAEAATAMRESWTGSDTLRLVAPPATPPDWDSLALLEASGYRADIATMEADAAMQRAMAGSMRASLRPDFMVGAMAMRMTDGMPGWGVMVGMTLPFAPWSASMATSEARGAEAAARASEANVEAMRRMAKSEVQGRSRRAIAAWNALRENDSLVLPGLRRAVDDARTRYAQGREMLSMVLSMEDMVRMSAMQAIMFRGEYELERIRLLAAAGAEIQPEGGAK
ncbi:MAG TPA: TolC family protein [Fibrobacteria bacterium]|nr:TolC family protein [Fibrobacteria bacterium]